MLSIHVGIMRAIACRALHEQFQYERMRTLCRVALLKGLMGAKNCFIIVEDLPSGYLWINTPQSTLYQCSPALRVIGTLSPFMSIWALNCKFPLAHANSSQILAKRKHCKWFLLLIFAIHILFSENYFIFSYLQCEELSVLPHVPPKWKDRSPHLLCD